MAEFLRKHVTKKKGYFKKQIVISILDYKMLNILIIIPFHDTKLHHNVSLNEDNGARALIV